MTINLRLRPERTGLPPYAVATPPTPDDCACLQWLATADARAAAHSDVARYGLTDVLEPDDLLAVVAEKLLRRLAGPGYVRCYKPPGLARTALKNAAIDLFRGARRHGRIDSVPFDDDDDAMAGFLPDDWTADPLARAATRDLIPCVRRFIDATAGDDARLASAADQVLLLVTFGEPAGGADLPFEPPPGGNRAFWCALWRAGYESCFPSPGHPDDAAMRKRRSRAIHKVKDLLAEAMVACGSGGPTTGMEES